MSFPRKKLGRQGTWVGALTLFASPLIIIFLLRWLFVEPFVIPSESMMPNLLVHDHIIVLKYSYGIKAPMGDGWIYKRRDPKRGEIIVFRYPENRDVFFIKRLIGLPGDKIKIKNGQITLNEKPWIVQRSSNIFLGEEHGFHYFSETIPFDQVGSQEYSTKQESDASSPQHLIRLLSDQSYGDSDFREFVVPPHSYFVMGDNRDQSHDSRFWGYVDEKYLIGRAAYVWLSCEETISMAPMICDPLKIRSERLFKRVEDL